MVAKMRLPSEHKKIKIAVRGWLGGSTQLEQTKPAAHGFTQNHNVWGIAEKPLICYANIQNK